MKTNAFYNETRNLFGCLYAGHYYPGPFFPIDVKPLGAFVFAGIIWYGGYTVITGHGDARVVHCLFLTVLDHAFKNRLKLLTSNERHHPARLWPRRKKSHLHNGYEAVQTIQARRLALPPIAKGLEFRDVHFGYDEQEVLRGLNLYVNDWGR